MDFKLLLEVAAQLCSLQGLWMMALGVAVGILGGALPGISTTMTVALLATATYSMDPLWAIVFLASAQVGATYGGSIAATVLNIPGTPASASTAREGYVLTQKGLANKALGVNVFASFVGNTVGVIALLAIMPVVLKLSMKFGPWELFWFAMFGIVICTKLSRANFVKGLIAACFGLMAAFVGLDPIGGTMRLTFGIGYLRNGIPLVPAMIGLYGMSEVFTSLIDYKPDPVKMEKERLFQHKIWWKYKWMSIRASLLGFIIGLVPGIGANIASWVGYDHAYSGSKYKEEFGNGSIEGLIGSESANNGCVPGAYAPLLALGVPGDAVTAVILGILTIHGVQPGPSFLTNNPQYLYYIALAILFAGVVFLLVGTFVGRGIVKVLTIPLPAIMAGVVVLCAIGGFSSSNRIPDVYIMFVFGIIGLLMKKTNFPIAPMLLGLVVGGELADANFRRAILAGKGSFLPFISRPVSAILVACLLFVVLKEFVWPLIRKPQAAKTVTASAAAGDAEKTQNEEK